MKITKEKLFVMAVSNSLFAFITSLIQTARIIHEVRRNNGRNIIVILALALFATIVAGFQTHRIMNKDTGS